MAIKCGHCRQSHGTVSQVRACSQTPYVPAAIRPAFTEQDERDMQRMEAEGDRAETIRDEAAKAQYKESVETGAAFSELTERVAYLLRTRVIPMESAGWARAIRSYVTGRAGVITEHALQTAIARLETFRETAPAQSAKADCEGLYRLSRPVRSRGFDTGDLFQVLRGKDSKKLYAKHVIFNNGAKTRPTLTYAPGMIFDLLESELVPAEEAQEITRKTGWCVFGHFLTNPVSIARGMGPTCYARYPHLAKNVA